MDKLSSLFHRERSAFENAHNAQSRLAASDRFGSRVNALRKVSDLHLESFGYIQLRGEHITRAVADKSLVERVRRIGYSNSSVVHLYLFARLHVVIHNHL